MQFMLSSQPWQLRHSPHFYRIYLGCYKERWGRPVGGWKRRRGSGRPSAPHALPRQQQQTALDGLTCLCAVSLLWGTYTPSVRLVYSLPQAPDVVVLSGLIAVLQVVALAAAEAASGQSEQSAEAPGAAELAAPPCIKGGNELASLLQRLQRLPSAVRGGLEIGAYDAAATLAQAWGLTVTTATHGAFLIQVEGRVLGLRFP